MKPGFYISMGVAIAGLIIGFVLLYDIQKEKESENIWIQKIPKQCSDVWSAEYNEYYQINPDMDSNSKEIQEAIISSHYEKLGLTVLEINLEQNYFDGVRCEACSCLGWDRLSMKIPEEQLDQIPQDEGWEKIE